MSLPLSPFATVDKNSVIGRLVAAGSHDPDVLDQERARLLSAVRGIRVAGLILLPAGVVICFTGAGPLAGIPMVVVATWLMYRGKRNVDAIKAGFAEFVQSPGL